MSKVYQIHYHYGSDADDGCYYMGTYDSNIYINEEKADRMAKLYMHKYRIMRIKQYKCKNYPTSINYPISYNIISHKLIN